MKYRTKVHRLREALKVIAAGHAPADKIAQEALR